MTGYNALAGFSSNPDNNIIGYTHMAFHHLANKYTAHPISSTTMLTSIRATAYSTYCHVTYLMNIH